MSLVLISVALPLFAVSPDDALLSSHRTFVSANAQNAASENGANVLCLERSRLNGIRHICLTEQEWRDAVEHAETQAAGNQRQRLIDRAQFYAGL